MPCSNVASCANVSKAQIRCVQYELQLIVKEKKKKSRGLRKGTSKRENRPTTLLKVNAVISVKNDY